jgi:hypothetical protein
MISKKHFSNTNFCFLSLKSSSFLILEFKESINISNNLFFMIKNKEKNIELQKKNKE